jgi:hypothetical protein
MLGWEAPFLGEFAQSLLKTGSVPPIKAVGISKIITDSANRKRLSG